MGVAMMINKIGAGNVTIRPNGGTFAAMTHIRDNDTSIRLALNTIKTEGVPAIYVAFERTSYGTVGLC